MTNPARRAATRGLPAAVLGSALVLTACGGGSASPASSTGTTSAGPSSPAASSTASKLASGLLPPEAFGAQATVVAVTVDQLRQGAGIAAAAKNLTITPHTCADAVHGTQPQLADFHDVAAQSATQPGMATVEVLFRGGPTKDAVTRLAAAVRACPRATVTSPQIGTGTLTFEALPVPPVGDGAAAVRYTTALTQPNGTRVTVPALIGLVQDGDRLVTLLSLGTGGTAPDATAFPLLLQKAYSTEHDALD